MQGVAFQHTVNTAVTEAEGGQLIARRIIYLLEKMKTRPSMDIVEDLLEELHDLIDSQLKRIRQVKTGFEGIRQGLLTIARQAESIQGQISHDQSLALKEAHNSRRNMALSSAAAFLTAWTVAGGLVFGACAVDQALHRRSAVRQGRDAAEASQLLDGLCSGIDSVIGILTTHVDFWSDLSAEIESQLAGMTRDALTKDRAGTRTVRIGIVDRGADDWRRIEGVYRQYASNVSPPR
ncbi:hypothetical protein HWV62_13078 [Athelia sp. TMB]|nr:hypothetical protein HWV62_13078 [Athelia sp. TMB]